LSGDGNLLELEQKSSFLDRHEIANELNLKADTLRKAISSGKLHKPQKKLLPTEPAATTSKSERSRVDASLP